MLSAGPVDVGGVALLAEEPVCEHETEHKPLSKPAVSSGRKRIRGGTGIPHRTRSGWRAGRRARWRCPRSATGCSARPPPRAAARARRRGSAPSQAAACRRGVAGAERRWGLAAWGLGEGRGGEVGISIWFSLVFCGYFWFSRSARVRERG